MSGSERRRFRSSRAAAAAIVLCLGLAGAGPAPAEPYRLGTPADAATLAPWDIDVSPDGAGLPAGRGTVAAGRKVYDAQCAGCHGATGEGGLADRLAGGSGTLASAKKVKTIGSFWPYATTLYDFIYRAMPYTAPQSLAPDEVYAVTAYLLHLNGILPADAVLDAKRLPAVRMPNRDGFVADARPDTPPPPLHAADRRAP